jgi:hypothetical protein
MMAMGGGSPEAVEELDGGILAVLGVVGHHVLTMLNARHQVGVRVVLWVRIQPAMLVGPAARGGAQPLSVRSVAGRRCVALPRSLASPCAGLLCVLLLRRLQGVVSMPMPDGGPCKPAGRTWVPLMACHP